MIALKPLDAFFDLCYLENMKMALHNITFSYFILLKLVFHQVLFFFLISPCLGIFWVLE